MGFSRFLLFIMMLVPYALVNGHDVTTPEIPTPFLIEQKLKDINTKIELYYSPLMESKVKEFTQTYRKGTEVLLERKSIYGPQIIPILKENNIPEELIYMTFVESKLDPRATSYVGAKGIWQFMPNTGRSLGLKISDGVDERMSISKSTKAAGLYLNELHREFNNWTLALAAYNSGAGNMRKAIKKSGSREYLELMKYLPKQTQNYVAKFTAMIYIMHYLDEFGFEIAD